MLPRVLTQRKSGRGMAKASSFGTIQMSYPRHIKQSNNPSPNPFINFARL